MKIARALAGLASLLAAGGSLALAYAWRGEIQPVDTPSAASFDPALVRKGHALALVGDCRTCHTEPGGTELAGGLAMPTPFGTIYSTNITPDRETGIGAWSRAAFRRAMNEGVGRTGEHLYPAFPFDHFTLATDDDVDALYAYLMTREPVAKKAPANELPFPINVRLVLAGWKLLFFREGRYEPDPAQDATWNRGKYLVDGLGHCGACHTPRNLMGAEDRSREFQGGQAEGWQAFALAGSSQARVTWTQEALRTYLRNGWQADHGAALGPMRPVTENLADAPEADVAAMARYLASLAPAGSTPPAPPRPEPRAIPVAGLQAPTPAAAGGASRGRAIHDASCASCHDSGRPLPLGGLPLSLSSAVVAESPRNLVNLIVEGIPARPGMAAPVMPSFGPTMSDGDIVALATDLRTRLGGKAVWPDLEAAIAEARRRQRPLRHANNQEAQP